MSMAEILSCALEAWTLLAAHPWLWLGVAVGFLVAVESLTFIPYVGFTLKLAVASLAGTGIVLMFSRAAAGQTPTFFDMLQAFALPVATQIALVVGALVPFAAGLLYLHVRAGRSAAGFFFGNVFKAKPPPKEVFVRFKFIMVAVALPLSLLPGAIVLKGLAGFAAIAVALGAATTSWSAIVVFGVSAIAFECLTLALPGRMPKPAAFAAVLALLVAFVIWSFALTYTVSAKAFAPTAMSVSTHPATAATNP